jgi:hypothetical protein
MLGWMGKRLRAGAPPASVVVTAGPHGRAAAAPSIGVEPLAPRVPRPEQLAIPVPPAEPPAAIAADPAQATTTAEDRARLDRPKRTGSGKRRSIASDLAPKKNPF